VTIYPQRCTANLVVYVAQQVHQFQQQGKEFAMQHRGVHTELVKVMTDLLESLSDEERLRVYPIRKRLQGLSMEELLRELSPKDVERLRQLLQNEKRADDSSRPQ
jgi:hypothetical protein